MAKWCRPNSCAIDTARASPRALNEPVGNLPSSFTMILPALPPSFSALVFKGMSGVITSPSEMRLSDFVTGSIGAYRQNPLAEDFVISSLRSSTRILSRSYRTNSGRPASDKPCTFPASYILPVREHSRCVTKFVIFVSLDEQALQTLLVTCMRICQALNFSSKRYIARHKTLMIISSVVVSYNKYASTSRLQLNVFMDALS